MRGTRVWRLFGVLGSATGLAAGFAAAGCSSMGSAFEFTGSPFTAFSPQAQQTGPTTTGRQTGTALQTGTDAFTDPCTETAARKLVRISMRNQSSDYIHYFLLMVAFVNGTEYPAGGVCADDIPLYTAFGYTRVQAGQSVPFGNVCVVGPALYYFHRGGQFRTAGGTAGRTLGSAIGPAQGSTPTYDATFGSAGLTVPVPDLIIFHNPGTTTEGRALKISRNSDNPCAIAIIAAGDPACVQDAYYYVDENDRISGSTALGTGAGRRVASDIQGSGCECRGTSDPGQALAPSGQSALNAACDQFFRGGRIDYVFVRDDTDPPYPQMLWRVTDSAGARAHDYDARGNVR